MANGLQLERLRNSRLKEAFARDNLVPFEGPDGWHVDRFPSRKHPHLDPVITEAGKHGFQHEFEPSGNRLTLMRGGVKLVTAELDRGLVLKFVVHDVGPPAEQEINVQKITSLIGSFFGDPKCRP